MLKHTGYRSSRTDHKNPTYLDILALAYHRTGDTARALKIEEKALALLPSGDSPLRKALEARLAEFRRAAASQPAASQPTTQTASQPSSLPPSSAPVNATSRPTMSHAP